MKKIVYLAITMILLAGCSLSTTNSNNNVGGSLILSLESNSSRTIVPTITMEVASYDISATSPNSASFVDQSLPDTESFTMTDITESTIQMDDLVVGIWEFTITGKNANGTIIVSGTKSIEIIKDDTLTTSIILNPVAGNGSLSVDISWPVEDITTPIISASITSTNDIKEDITFTIDSNTASFSTTTVDSGYYTLKVLLYDDTEFVWGMIESVRIVKDHTTSADLTLTSEDLNLQEISPTGSLILSITSNTENPIELTLSGNESTIKSYEDMIVTVTASLTPDSYKWYLNGDLITGETSNTLTINGSTVKKTNFLTAEVKKGNILSSISHTFKMQQAPHYNIKDKTPSGGWVFYDKGSYSDGWRYIEAASADIVGMKAYGKQSFSGATNDGFGLGKNNTLNIIQLNDAVDKAADACSNYSVTVNEEVFDEWYLPSNMELIRMYDVLKSTGGFVQDYYWSSTEDNNSSAYEKGFQISPSYNRPEYKDSMNYVRAIRYF